MSWNIIQYSRSRYSLHKPVRTSTTPARTSIRYSDISITQRRHNKQILNFEVGFRASTDNGAKFGPITNLSNTDNSDSINAEISAEGGISCYTLFSTAMICYNEDLLIDSFHIVTCDAYEFKPTQFDPETGGASRTRVRS